MRDLVERADVLALAKEIVVPTKWDTEYRHRSIDPLDVRELPTANTRDVVTCGECIFRHRRPGCQGRKPNWFCADGVAQV